MKKVFNIILFACMSSLVFSIGDPYTEAMKEGMTMLEKAQNSDDFLAAANQFERISNVAADNWHPAYYTAYARAIAASMVNESTRKEELLDQAEVALKKASGVDHDKSEVGTLQGFIHMLRIAVDPNVRGQQYSMMSSASLQKALAINPDNPRAMYMQAQLSFGTAQFFGSDTSDACAAVDRAISLFEKSEMEPSADPFAPNWGKLFALSFQKQCTD
ncbi:MAG: hypothetical protein KJP00_00615 [Bacteroidia bacterium]|nr:hypothetical protein [Bacteroidia bacterium]